MSRKQVSIIIDYLLDMAFGVLLLVVSIKWIIDGDFGAQFMGVVLVILSSHVIQTGLKKIIRMEE